MAVSPCFAKSCDVSTGKFFLLPVGDHNEQRRNEWLNRVGRNESEINFYKNSYYEGSDTKDRVKICEKHFSDLQFKVKDGIRKLKSNAVPDLFIEFDLFGTELGTISIIPAPKVELEECEPEVQLDESPVPSSTFLNVVDMPQSQQSVGTSQLILRETSGLQTSFRFKPSSLPDPFPLRHTKVGQGFVMQKFSLMPKLQPSKPSKYPSRKRKSKVQSNLDEEPAAIPCENPFAPNSTKSKAASKKQKNTTVIESTETNSEENKHSKPKRSKSSTKTLKFHSVLPRLAPILPPLLPKIPIPVARYCRLCAEVKPQTISIFGAEGRHMGIPQMIEKCMPIQVNENDLFPLLVCTDCLYTLRVCNDVVARCIQADNKLRQLLEDEEFRLSRTQRTHPKEIPILYIPTEETQEPMSSTERPLLRVVTEKLIHVDETLPPTEQITQVIEDVKAGKGTTDDTMLYAKEMEQSELEELLFKDRSRPPQKFQCSMCNSILRDSFSVYQHRLCKFRCRACPGRFCSDKARRRHQTAAHPPPPLQIKPTMHCKYCKQDFFKRKDMRAHQLLKHNLKCDFCEAIFTVKSKLINHIKRHFNNTVPQCKMCLNFFATKKSLKRHIEDNECVFKPEAIIYSCKICACTFRTKRLYKKHMDDHEKKNLRTCDLCGKGFRMLCKYKQHLAFHGIGRKYPCPICPKQCATQGMLQYHLEVHANERKYRCDICDGRYLHKVHLHKHIRTQHLQLIKFICNICKATFFEKHLVEKHLETHSKEEKRLLIKQFTMVTPFHCEKCDKYFAKTSSLQKHRRVHETGDDVVMCEFCGMNVRCRALQLHMGRYHRDNANPRKNQTGAPEKSKKILVFQCNECPTSFNTKVKLIAHQSSHTGIKPFSCSFCDKSFNYKSVLKDHENVHRGIKTFVCRYCSQAFFSVNTRTIHEREAHTLERPYVCKFCSKKFTRQSNYVTHVRIHTGERPYQCDECGNCFTQKTTLDKHVATHTGERKVYGCSECSFTAKLRRITEEHIQQKHPAEQPAQEDPIIIKITLPDPKFVGETVVVEEGPTYQIEVVDYDDV